MTIQIKVKVKKDTLKEFAEKLMTGVLDRSAVTGEAYCEKKEPAVGISYWKVDDMQEFEDKFSAWRPYYEEVEIKEVITAKEAMFALFS